MKTMKQYYCKKEKCRIKSFMHVFIKIEEKF